MKKISIIIPVFNQVDFTKQVIDSIEDNIQLSDSYELLIINNASSDRTQEYLKIRSKFNKNIKVINLKKNIYVNPAWNLWASRAKWEYLIFMNNDITLFKNFDVKMLAYYEWKVVCPCTLNYGQEHSFKQNSNINGTCFMIKKSDYVPVPEYLKLWYWDDFIYRTLWVNWLFESVVHWGSQTLNTLPNVQEIIDKDTELWKWVLKVQNWSDGRFN